MSEEDTSVVGNVLSCDNIELSKWFKRNYIYVDKSLFIKEFMNIDGSLLFTRPRRFGKTLNMMLLQKFLSLFEEEPDERFKALKIFQDVDFVNEHHRKYPVFLISFLATESNNWESMKKEIKSCILESVKPLTSYLENLHIDDNSMKAKRYQKMIVLLEEMNDKLNDAFDVNIYFRSMMGLVKDYFGIEPIVLIDEYDAPIRRANEGGFLDDALGLFKPFYSALSKVLPVKLCFTGILRVAANTVLSSMNNLVICDIDASDKILDRFSGMFGFTKEEIEELVQKCHENGMSTPAIEDLESYYDGYIFGKSTRIFNPYSVMHALYKGELGHYWTVTGSAGNIINFAKNYEPNIDLTELVELISQGSSSIACSISNASGIVYGKVSSLAALHTILYHCGYLTKVIEETDGKAPTVQSFSLGRKTALRIPNLEVQENLKSDIFSSLFKSKSMQQLTALFIRGLEEGDFWGAFDFIVANTIFSLDSKTFALGNERNYHMAFTLFFTHFYHASGSMKEHRQFYEASTGAGIADLIIEIPVADGEILGVIFEFKYAQKEQEMEKRALQGLSQIVKKNYLNHFLKARAASRVLLVGLSCHKLEVVFCYQLATRLPPSSSFVLDPSEAKYCFFPADLESRASNEQMQT